MKKFVKRLLKWTGITLGVVIIALILIPVFFKDQLKDLVVREVNKTLNAELSLGDFDLTFLSTFPNMTVVLDETKLTGTATFDKVTLADVDSYIWGNPASHAMLSGTEKQLVEGMPETVFAGE